MLVIEAMPDIALEEKKLDVTVDDEVEDMDDDDDVTEVVDVFGVVATSTLVETGGGTRGRVCRPRESSV